jgi:hypothetical protein
MSVASSTSHISWASKFVNDVIVNAHRAGGHGVQRNRLLIRARELEQQEEGHDGGGAVGGSNSGSSSYGSTNSSSNSETESSTDEEAATQTQKTEDGNDSKLKSSAVVPNVEDTDAQKTPPLPSSTLISTWYSFLEVADWDRENKRVMKLALPYLNQAFFSGVAKAAVVAIIGKYYGTRSLTAFVVIEMTVGLTTEFFGGELRSFKLGRMHTVSYHIIFSLKTLFTSMIIRH